MAWSGQGFWGLPVFLAPGLIRRFRRLTLMVFRQPNYPRALRLESHYAGGYILIAAQVDVEMAGGYFLIPFDTFCAYLIPHF